MRTGLAARNHTVRAAPRLFLCSNTHVFSAPPAGVRFAARIERSDTLWGASGPDGGKRNPGQATPPNPALRFAPCGLLATIAKQLLGTRL